MFTTIRQYRADPSVTSEIARAIDEQFADRLGQLPGFVAYEAIDCGSGEFFTTTVFADRESAERSTELASDFIRESLAGIELERISSWTGEVVVNRAKDSMLEMVHA